MNELKKIYHKVGGTEILKRYWKAGILGFVLIEAMILGFSRKSLEILRLAAEHRILCKLKRKNNRFIRNYREENELKIAELSKERSKKVWVCWLQGIENAPEIVQICYRSLLECLPDREIVVITRENYQEYITFPENIQKKFDQGIITNTHFSDLLRMELLLNYGGTWIDATVLCTSKKVPEYLLDSDLFFYQTLKPGRDGHAVVMSSWFITACTNNPILLLTRALIYHYWDNHDFMIDYFLFHDFFQIALEQYPDDWNRVVPVSNEHPHILLLRFFEKYDEKIWNCVKEMTCFHKLSYKFSEEQLSMKNTYYKALIKGE